MDIQKVTNHRVGVSSGLFLGQHLPLSIGYPFAKWIAHWIAQQKDSPIVKTVRANQAVIRGTPSSQELDRAVCAVFSHAGRCFVDLYHNFRQPDKLAELVQDSPDISAFIKMSRESNHGILLVTPHLSNFDLGLLYLATRGLRAQVLTIGQPAGGYKIQNVIRSNYGLDITPITKVSLENAFRRLKRGGVVATGIERPIESHVRGPLLPFFGRPAPLPTGYIRMALKTGARIVVAAVELLTDGTYCIKFSEPLEMQHRPDKLEEILNNGHKILQIVEHYIQENPDQWLMFNSVWPENAGLVG